MTIPVEETLTVECPEPGCGANLHMPCVDNGVQMERPHSAREVNYLEKRAMDEAHGIVYLDNGWRKLPCGCQTKTAIEDGERTFIIEPHSEDCEYYRYSLELSRKQGNRETRLNVRD